MTQTKECEGCKLPMERKGYENNRDWNRRRFHDIKCGRIGKQATQATKDKMAKAKRGKIGAESNAFKGDAVGYKGLHSWIRVHWGTPDYCERCKCTKPPKAYQSHWFEWANVTGVYNRERENWQRLCLPCHHHEDAVNAKNVKRDT